MIEKAGCAIYSDDRYGACYFSWFFLQKLQQSRLRTMLVCAVYLMKYCNSNHIFRKFSTGDNLCFADVSRLWLDYHQFTVLALRWKIGHTTIIWTQVIYQCSWRVQGKSYRMSWRYNLTKTEFLSFGKLQIKNLYSTKNNDPFLYTGDTRGFRGLKLRVLNPAHVMPKGAK